MPSRFTVNQLSEPPSVSGGIARRGEQKGRQVTGIRAGSEEEVDLASQRKEGSFFISPPHAPGFEDGVNYVWA